MATVVAFAFSGDSLLSGEFILEPGLNVVYGLNGAGKTRLLRGVRASLIGVASDVGGGVIVRLGGDTVARNPIAGGIRSLEHALAAALAFEGEYWLGGSHVMGRSLPHERTVADDQVFDIIDRVIAEAAGHDESLVEELVRDRYFILMPTGNELNPSWDAWPVADVTLPEARSAFGAVQDYQHVFLGQHDLDDDEALYEYTDALKEFTFFALDEAFLRSRAKGRLFSPGPGDRFHPYWHGPNSGGLVGGTSIEGPLDFGYDLLDAVSSVDAATSAHLALMTDARIAAHEPRSILDSSARDTPPSEDLEIYLDEAAKELSANVTAALQEVLLDGPTATLAVPEAWERFAKSPAMWHFGRTGSSQALTIDKLSRAERNWADHIIIDELSRHHRDSLALDPDRRSDPLRPIVALLDEPEAGLHRAAEAHMARSVRRRASDPRRWIVAATHSPELLDVPDAHITEISREFKGGLESRIHRLSLSDRSSLHSLGLRPSDLLQMNRVYLLVEGLHDEVLLQHYFASRLAEARVRVVPIRGATQLASTFDSQVLYHYTSAHIVVLLDNLQRESVSEGWAKAKAAALRGETAAAVEELLHSIRTRDERGKRIDEAQFIVDWLRQGIEQGAAGRLTPEGMSRADIIEYLPIERVITGYSSWDELRAEHQTERASKKESPSDFKRWLELRKGLSFDAESLRSFAADRPPAEFERLMKTLEAISLDVASA